MITVNNWDKFKLLLWKNWKLQCSHKFALVMDVFTPTLFMLFLVLLRQEAQPIPMAAMRYAPQDITNLDLLKETIVQRNAPMMPKFELLYSPKNDLLENIVEAAAKSLKLTGSRGYANAKDLQLALTTSNFLAGVQFDDEWQNLISYPEKFQFALRFPSELRTDASVDSLWFTRTLFPMFDSHGPRNVNASDGGIPVGYLREGFLPLQHALSMAYLQLAGNVKSLPYVDMQRYPYPEYIVDEFLDNLHYLLPLLVLFSFLYPCSMITQGIAVEKEKQLKEIMKIMGLDNWLHWTAWFVKSFLKLGISCLLITLLLKSQWFGNMAVLPHSSFSATLCFLLIYALTSICYCFLLSTLFSKANTAAVITGLLWYISYMPYSFTSRQQRQLTNTHALCLFSNTAMGFGFSAILSLEVRGEGLQWSNLFTPTSVDDDLTMGGVIIVMLLSSALYLTVCLYVEQIHPGDYGVPKKWYFLFTRHFWCGDEKMDMDNVPIAEIENRDPTTFEPEPSDKKVSVQLKNLSKKIGDRMVVNELSLNMYENEITVLLGHNGAGKTTTISMLTGMFPPTSGTAVINGSDIRTNIEGVRSSMGFCPQHNVLFDDLSVANHIVFFSRLRGLKGEAIQKEVKKYLELIGLEHKANVASSKLSGGMKRKLSICCALSGGSKVVLCDETSSGMDPASRRQFWDLLQAEKIGRTLLLTTHSMDEADVLGDRIAIMCDGKLKCYGTSFFLKKKYGSGYRLICIKNEDCNVDEVTALLRRYVPEIEPASVVGAELLYQLPDSYSTLFEGMLSDLEEKSGELNLNGYGIGITSMEEVFMQAGVEKSDNDELQQSSLSDNVRADDDVETVSTADIFANKTQLLKGTALYRNQWYAMLLKKRLYSLRRKWLFLVQLIIAIFCVVALFKPFTKDTFKELEPMTISLAQYPQAVTVLATAREVESKSLGAEIAKEYKTIASSYGPDYAFQSTGSQSFSDYILGVGKTMQAQVDTCYLAAATVRANNITAWLNNEPLHTAPLTLNLVHNAMARAIIGDTSEITVTNAPLPCTTQMRLTMLATNMIAGAFFIMNLGLCMCFISSFYVIFLITERRSRAKLLQFVSGVRVWIFWFSHLLWDMATYACVALVVILTMACFQGEGFSSPAELARYFLVFVIFGFSMLPFTYLMSFLFTKPDIGFARVMLLNFFAGVILFLVSVLMTIFSANARSKAEAWQWYFRLFPQFSLETSLQKLFINGAVRNMCSKLTNLQSTSVCELFPDCCNVAPYFGWQDPGILPEIVYMIATGLVFLLLILLCDYRVFGDLLNNIRRKCRNKWTWPIVNSLLEEDVQREKQHVLAMLSGELGSKNLVLQGLTKYYGNLLAVNDISVAVERKACLGLLGVNGAGKTTTFKMLTGDERLTDGAAYVNGLSLERDMNTVYKEIGYCPQHDTLMGFLTGRETLEMFSLIRGFNRLHLKRICQEFAKSFRISSDIDKQTQAYSGGNKRKLSTAVAVIGSPSVIYLDEPTTGIDPAARRQLWNVLCRVRDAGESIVLSSHSMEECEALCTRLAIMVNGQFKCIGSAQHLKNKFFKGVILKVKVKCDMENANTNAVVNSVGGNLTKQQGMQADMCNVKQLVKREFPQAILQEEYQSMLTFYIPLMSIKWSQIFGLIERNRAQLNVEDYLISQTTLEDIFLEFAKYQREDKRALTFKKA